MRISARLYDLVRKSRYHGSIDTVSDKLIRGWARDTRRPHARLSIEIYAGGALLGVARTDSTGDGNFVFAPPAAVAENVPIAARVAETEHWLTNSSGYAATNAHRPVRGGNISPRWARALADDGAFKKEQAALGHCWTLLGVAADLKKDGDWFRATLGGRSIFVQRFGDAIRGFENRCAHRFFPLRTADKGNGPVVCGFHHWHYNRDGHAVGIPNCLEAYGTTPRELGAKLVALDIARCGSLVFGRFPGGDASESLEDYLGEGFPILEATCAMPERPQRLDNRIAANWKLLIQITLDDYHNVAIHHRKNYSRNDEITYFRFGMHSAHFTGNDDTLASMAAQCRENRYRPTGYRILNIFPNLAVVIFGARPYWYCYVQSFAPISAGHTRQRGWLFRTGFAARERAIDRWTRPVSDVIRALFVRHFVKKIGDEDQRACEQLQTIAHQLDRSPMLCAQERRIEWFEEAYEAALARGDAMSGPGHK